MAREEALRQQQDIDDDPDPKTPKPGSEDTEGLVVDLADLEDDRRAGASERDKEKDKDGGDIGARSALEEGDAEAARLREARRQARREERRARRDADREREERRDQEIEDMRAQVGSLTQALQERRQVDYRTAYQNMEAEQAALQRQYEEARALKEKAFKDTDAAAAVRADEIMQAARDSYAQLDFEKRKLVAAVRQEQQPKGPHPEVAKHFKEFARDVPWYDRNGGDADSAAVLAIDRKMYADGWDPTTPGYWKELRRRAKEELPHRRFGDDVDNDGDRGDGAERGRRKQFVGGGGDGDGGAGDLGEGRVRVPPEYIRNLKEAGLWGDERNPSKEELATRNRMIRRYIEGRKQLDQRR